MELRHLRYFVAVAEEEHVGRAAERLHVSSSPLSRQIRQLEAEVGVDLFRRVGRGVRLTPAGTAYLGRARELLDGVERAAKEAQAISRGALGRLSLAFNDTRAYAQLVPEVITGFRALHPKVAVDVSLLGSQAQLEALRAGALDAGFGHQKPTEPGLRAEALYSERILLALPLDHPLAKRKAVTAAMLKDQPFVWILGPKPQLFEGVERALREKGVPLQVALEVRSSSEARLSLVASGMGLTFAVESAKAALPKQVVLRQLSDLRLESRAYLVWRSADEESPLLRSLRSVAQAARRRLFP
jgi:DNA-binding transcriptional LysR family regulator